MKNVIQNLTRKKTISLVVSGLLLIYWLVLMIENGLTGLSPLGLYFGIFLGFSYLIFTLIQFFLLEKDSKTLFFLRFSISFLKWLLVLIPLFFNLPLIYENSNGIEIFEVILYWMSFPLGSGVFVWEIFFNVYEIFKERNNKKVFFLCYGFLVLLLADLFALILLQAIGGKLANAPAELSFFFLTYLFGTLNLSIQNKSKFHVSFSFLVLVIFSIIAFSLWSIVLRPWSGGDNSTIAFRSIGFALCILYIASVLILIVLDFVNKNTIKT